ncbi:ABC transporter ATP-binding protein [Derxia gummosa]|uniref:ABC transporter ATP-binding protein n=1 Tax=Derxia gummosa DSM 723 TaxID=1121388 RepID=A0A9U5CJN0_9BURK|nr:ABC transporter ATP-binding protein [Derxia gummosa]
MSGIDMSAVGGPGINAAASAGTAGAGAASAVIAPAARGDVLSVRGLKVGYGGIQAVKGVDLDVNRGELVTLIGANGAGKTTTLKAITGGVGWSGDIAYMGKSIAGRKAFHLLREGLVMVPEGRGVFARMTITENLLMGAHVRSDGQVQADIDRMFGLFPRLKERAGQLAGTMSGGEQQMLAMARALMSQPKLLLLDEPSMGLSPIMVEKVFEVVRSVHAEGTTILLVEQNARLALQIADRGYVMDSGEVTLTGPAARLLDDPKVRAAYLGEEL